MAIVEAAVQVAARAETLVVAMLVDMLMVEVDAYFVTWAATDIQVFFLKAHQVADPRAAILKKVALAG
jgi:hypothetical protein